MEPVRAEQHAPVLVLELGFVSASVMEVKALPCLCPLTQPHQLCHTMIPHHRSKIPILLLA